MLDLLYEVTGTKIEKRQAAEIVKQCAVDFDDFYDSHYKASQATKAPTMVLTTDGKDIMMCPEGLKEKTRERAAKKRMAQGASIYTTLRFWPCTE